MDFSTKYTVRTDLADEVLENLGEKRGIIGDGIEFETWQQGTVRVDTVRVKNELAARECSKPVGRYVTVNTGKVWKSDRKSFELAVNAVAEQIRRMLPQSRGLCLVAALGNRNVTADAIGPLAARSVIASRHIKKQSPELFSTLGLCECACITPGVMGNTGAEAYEIIKGAVDVLRPSCVVVVDALASRRLDRLAKTVQICDTGISPGSGVGNARHEISEKTLGVPTVAVGVPTVVEAGTLCLDILSEAIERESELFEYIERKMPKGTESFFVCPKETDRIIKAMSDLVGYAVNLAVHEGMTVSDVDEFLM